MITLWLMKSTDEIVVVLIITAILSSGFLFWWPLFAYSWHYWFG